MLVLLGISYLRRYQFVQKIILLFLFVITASGCIGYTKLKPVRSEYLPHTSSSIYPDKIEIENGVQKNYYQKGGYNYRGYIAYALIPIPLVVPAGPKYTVEEVNAEGEVVDRYTMATISEDFICFVFPIYLNSMEFFGCID